MKGYTQRVKALILPFSVKSSDHTIDRSTQLLTELLIVLLSHLLPQLLPPLPTLSAMSSPRTDAGAVSARYEGALCITKPGGISIGHEGTVNAKGRETVVWANSSYPGP